MELRSKRKSLAFRFRKSSKQPLNIDYIHHQATLVGSFLTLMENQMSLIAVLRKKSANSESLFPFGFKVEKHQVPSDLIPLEINSKNLVTVTIPECGSFPAMIVAVGSDSQELFESYKVFYDSAKKKSINNLEKKITCWINTEGIELHKIKSKGLPAVEEDKFREILYKLKIEETNREKSLFEKTPVAGTSSSFLNISMDTNEENLLSKKPQNEENMSSVNKSLKLIREMNESIMNPQMVKTAFSEVVKILEAILLTTNCNDLTKPVKHQAGKRINFSQTREIPEKNPTYEAGKITMVEGVLPLLTRDYKRALSMGNPKNPSLSCKPTTTITNIVKFAFPKHWLSGVTLRGAGGNRSLTSVWSYSNPLLDPCEGEIEENLGEIRLQALFDHAVRKSRKLSYDKAMEETMISALSKALHYFKSKLAPSKPQRSKKIKKDDFSSIYGDFDTEGDDSLDFKSTEVSEMNAPPEEIFDEENQPPSKQFDFSNLEESGDSIGGNSTEEKQFEHNKEVNTLGGLLEPLELDLMEPDADDSTGLNKILTQQPKDLRSEIGLNREANSQQISAAGRNPHFSINEITSDNPDTSNSVGEIRNISDMLISSSEEEFQKRGSCGTTIERVEDDSGINQSFGQVLTSTPLKRVTQYRDENISKRFRGEKTLFSTISERFLKRKEVEQEGKKIKEKEKDKDKEKDKEKEREKEEETVEREGVEKDDSDEQQFDAEKFPMLKESDLNILKNLSDPKFAHQLAMNMAKNVAKKN